jgi:hypothetical protein
MANEYWLGTCLFEVDDTCGLGSGWHSKGDTEHNPAQFYIFHLACAGHRFICPPPSILQTMSSEVLQTKLAFGNSAAHHIFPIHNTRSCQRSPFFLSLRSISSKFTISLFHNPASYSSLSQNTPTLPSTQFQTIPNVLTSEVLYLVAIATSAVVPSAK